MTFFRASLDKLTAGAEVGHGSYDAWYHSIAVVLDEGSKLTAQELLAHLEQFPGAGIQSE